MELGTQEALTRRLVGHTIEAVTHEAYDGTLDLRLDDGTEVTVYALACPPEGGAELEVILSA